MIDSLDSNLKGCIWITWEKHRRTETLSRALGVELVCFNPPKNYFWKVLKLSGRTLATIVCRRPRCIIVQNPSMALTGLVALLKFLFRYRLVVDRHSNFKFYSIADRSLKYRIFHWISRKTIGKADLTIVTNDYLANVVDQWGGKSFVLQDKLPHLEFAKSRQLECSNSLLFVASFNPDEPVESVIAAASLLVNEAHLFISGNPARLDRKLRNNLPPNIELTGFLPESEFQSLMSSVDIVVGLTDQDHTLLCCAYEAVSLGKPLVLSETNALLAYFDAGAVYTGHKPRQLAEAFRTALQRRERLAQDSRKLGERLERDWEPRRASLVRVLASFCVSDQPGPS